MPFDTATDQWAAGLRLLEAAPADQRSVLEAVTRRIEAELRRRLGGPFTTEELAELYDEGTDWCSDIAYAAAPDHPVRLGRPHRGRRRVRALPARGHGLRRRAAPRLAERSGSPSMM